MQRDTARLLIVAILAAAIGAAAMTASRSMMALQSDRSSAPGKARADDPTSGHPLAGNFTADNTAVKACEETPLPTRFESELACREQAIGNVAFRDGPNVAFELVDA